MELAYTCCTFNLPLVCVSVCSSETIAFGVSSLVFEFGKYGSAVSVRADPITPAKTVVALREAPSLFPVLAMFQFMQ